MTVGEESSDKMKKPPFNRFSVSSKDQIYTDKSVCTYNLRFSDLLANWILMNLYVFF